MKEKTTIRENLMNEQGYAPYCGAIHCSYGTIRTKFDKTQSQFVCKCGWISSFPLTFIKRYINKWNIK